MHAQDDLNMHILRVFEGTLSRDGTLDVLVHIFFSSILYNRESKIHIYIQLLIYMHVLHNKLFHYENTSIQIY